MGFSLTTTVDRAMRAARRSYVAAWLGRWWLALWFGAVSLARLSILDPTHLLLDARLHIAASRAWMSGADPWLVAVEGLAYGAPPPSLLAAAPFALLPAGVDVAALEVAVIVAAVLSVRMLHLPWWWLAFPPLFECIVSGQVQAFLLPLLLGGWGWVAVLVKVYAAVPLVVLGRWRSLAIALAVMALTLPVLPWMTFISDFGSVTSYLAEHSQAGAGTFLTIVLAPLWIGALVLVGRQRAAWLAIALWPSPQPYYATLTMPAATGIVAAVIAAPFPGAPLAGLLVAGLLSLLARRRRSITVTGVQRPETIDPR